jgi:hypothetical protein
LKTVFFFVVEIVAKIDGQIFPDNGTANGSGNDNGNSSGNGEGGQQVSHLSSR